MIITDFGQKQKKIFIILFSKKKKNEFLPTFFPTFSIKFTFIAYACTFIPANNIIYDIGLSIRLYVIQTGKNCSHPDEKNFFYIVSKICKKMELLEK